VLLAVGVGADDRWDALPAVVNAWTGGVTGGGGVLRERAGVDGDSCVGVDIERANGYPYLAEFKVVNFKTGDPNSGDDRRAALCRL